MNRNFTEETGDTVRLLRPPPRVVTDPKGRTVWMGEVEVLELELVDTANADPYNTAGPRDLLSGT